MYTEDNLNQDFLVDEVGRLRDEAEGLRKALEKKIQQKEKQENADAIDTEAFKKVMDSSLEKLNESLEDMEAALTDSMDRNKNTLSELVSGNEKQVQEKLTEMDSSLTKGLGELKKNFSFVAASLGEVKELQDFLDQKIEDKAPKGAVNDLHRRLTAMFVVNIVSLGGSLMTLALLCYLIMALAR